MSIFQLAAAYDAGSTGRPLWAAWFLITWVGLVYQMTGLVMLLRGEE